MVPSEDADESAPRTRAGLFPDESVSNDADVLATPADDRSFTLSFVFSAFSAAVEFDDASFDSADAAAIDVLPLCTANAASAPSEEVAVAAVPAAAPVDDSGDTAAAAARGPSETLSAVAAEAALEPEAAEIPSAAETPSAAEIPSAVETASVEGFVDFTATIEVGSAVPDTWEVEDLDAFGDATAAGDSPRTFASTAYADEGSPEGFAATAISGAIFASAATGAFATGAFAAASFAASLASSAFFDRPGAARSAWTTGPLVSSTSVATGRCSGTANWNARRHPKTYATRRTPFTVPRSSGGDTSERYNGTICDDAPTPTPVMSRPRAMVVNEFAPAEMSVPTASGTVVAASAARRPSLSASGPMESPPRNPPATRTETMTPLRKLSPANPRSSAMAERGALITALW